MKQSGLLPKDFARMCALEKIGEIAVNLIRAGRAQDEQITAMSERCPNTDPNASSTLDNAWQACMEAMKSEVAKFDDMERKKRGEQ